MDEIFFALMIRSHFFYPPLKKIEIFREKKLYENFLILKKYLNF